MNKSMSSVWIFFILMSSRAYGCLRAVAVRKRRQNVIAMKICSMLLIQAHENMKVHMRSD